MWVLPTSKISPVSYVKMHSLVETLSSIESMTSENIYSVIIKMWGKINYDTKIAVHLNKNDGFSLQWCWLEIYVDSINWLTFSLMFE